MKITRRVALARMVFAGLATWFKDIPLPKFDPEKPLSGSLIPLGRYEMRIDRVKPGLGYLHWNGSCILIHEGNDEDTDPLIGVWDLDPPHQSLADGETMTVEFKSKIVDV